MDRVLELTPPLRAHINRLALLVRSGVLEVATTPCSLDQPAGNYPIRFRITRSGRERDAVAADRAIKLSPYERRVVLGGAEHLEPSEDALYFRAALQRALGT